MRGSLIKTYLTVGATFGFILAGPIWYDTLAGRAIPQNWPELKPLLIAFLLALGHGVLRAYLWLPSLAYNLGTHKMTFEHWLFGGVW
jgi:hypothetical protein